MAAAWLCVSRRRWISAMIFAANSALASRSSAYGRFRSANAGTRRKLSIGHLPSPHFPASLRSSWSRCRIRSSSRCGVAITEVGAPARPFPQIRATFSHAHVSDRSAPDKARNPACAEPQAGSPPAERSSRRAKSACAGVPASKARSLLYARTGIESPSEAASRNLGATPSLADLARRYRDPRRQSRTTSVK